MDPQLTNEDVADILALLDSLPYDELDLETPRFRLTLRRTPAGWTQSTQVLSEPEPLAARGHVSAPDEQAGTGEARSGEKAGADSGASADSGAGADGGGGELVAVRAPLPGTFYRAPRPGAAPFVEVGSRVSADTVIGI